jgi:hypothetical protein
MPGDMWSSVAAENSLVFHLPQGAGLLSESIGYRRQARLSVERLWVGGGG